jgi:ubiquinone/menaquinone biosynthesis C-methylase UbiE
MGFNRSDYSHVWTREATLEDLNARIHDGVPLDKLQPRAAGYRDTMFEILYPQARPRAGDLVVEFGSGVGWVMEAVSGRYDVGRIVGLDISAATIARARERWPDPRASFVQYDGLRLPFADASIPSLYSCAVIQHIDKHVAFLLLKEIFRVMARDGHAVLHFLSVHHIKRNCVPFEEECWNHVNSNQEVHWHHYYSFDELFTIFHELIGVDELDIQHYPDESSFFVHFSRSTGRPFARPELPSLAYPGRMAVGDHVVNLTSRIWQKATSLLRP